MTTLLLNPYLDFLVFNPDPLRLSLVVNNDYDHLSIIMKLFKVTIPPTEKKKISAVPTDFPRYLVELLTGDVRFRLIIPIPIFPHPFQSPNGEIREPDANAETSAIYHVDESEQIQQSFGPGPMLNDESV